MLEHKAAGAEEEEMLEHKVAVSEEEEEMLGHTAAVAEEDIITRAEEPEGLTRPPAAAALVGAATTPPDGDTKPKAWEEQQPNTRRARPANLFMLAVWESESEDPIRDGCAGRRSKELQLLIA